VVKNLDKAFGFANLKYRLKAFFGHPVRHNSSLTRCSKKAFLVFKEGLRKTCGKLCLTLSLEADKIHYCKTAKFIPRRNGMESCVLLFRTDREKFNSSDIGL